MASAVPSSRLIAPGPRVAEHTPARPVEPAIDLGHERRRLLMAHQHVPDRRPGQGIDEPDVLLARNTENDSDALPLQAAHKQIRDTKLLGHHRSLPSGSQPGLRWHPR